MSTLPAAFLGRSAPLELCSLSVFLGLCSMLLHKINGLNRWNSERKNSHTSDVSDRKVTRGKDIHAYEHVGTAQLAQGNPYVLNKNMVRELDVDEECLGKLFATNHVDFLHARWLEAALVHHGLAYDGVGRSRVPDSLEFFKLRSLVLRCDFRVELLTCLAISD